MRDPVGSTAAAERGTPGAVRSIQRAEEIDSMPLEGLSDHFGPFLPHFVREALRCGGRVRVAEADGVTCGLYLDHPADHEASIFTHDPALAAFLAATGGAASVFAEFELAPGAETYTVYRRLLATREDGHRFRHAVRIARPADRPGIVELLRSVYGHVDQGWIDTVPEPAELAFVVDGPEGLAGVAWANRIGTAGRLHSLTVRPRHRRTGIGSDLLFARLSWLAAAGARSAISEISCRSPGSIAIAEAGGMHPVGRIFRSARPSSA